MFLMRSAITKVGWPRVCIWATSSCNQNARDESWTKRLMVRRAIPAVLISVPTSRRKRNRSGMARSEANSTPVDTYRSPHEGVSAPNGVSSVKADIGEQHEAGRKPGRLRIAGLNLFHCVAASNHRQESARGRKGRWISRARKMRRRNQHERGSLRDTFWGQSGCALQSFMRDDAHIGIR